MDAKRGPPPALPPRQAVRLNARPPPPPLPPRAPSTPVTPFIDDPPPYDSVESIRPMSTPAWASHDPRSSSMQSLVPSKSTERGQRRKLMLIYIHGFMGDETSFQSFPAHVHNQVTALVAESHVVYTKIYPRYRSKRDISFSRNDFSHWLKPHESATTDIILLGHSMGGLLCAEIVLLQPSTPVNHYQLEHRLIGSVNFDVPFLGMHPGVIKSGLASIFSPASAPASPLQPASSSVTNQAASSSVQSLQSSSSRTSLENSLSSSPVDPNYNPSYENDVVLPIRKGWQNVWHFVNKHSDNITQATKQLVTSHMEFGAAMADFNGLKVRYSRIRALEEAAPAVRRSVVANEFTPRRRRYVNYYTASTGRPKAPETIPVADQLPTPAPPSIDNTNGSLHSGKEDTVSDTELNMFVPDAGLAQVPTPGSLVDEVNSDRLAQQKVQSSPEDEYEYEEEDDGDEYPEFEYLEPRPVSSADEASENESDSEYWTDAAEEFHPAELSITDQGGHSTTVTHATDPSDVSHAFTTPSIPNQSEISLVATTASGPSQSELSLVGTATPSARGQSEISLVTTTASTLGQSDLSLTNTASLPPIPELPSKPSQPDFSQYADKDARKLAEKEFSRASKAYEQAVKDRAKAQRDRVKLDEKRAKRAQQERVAAAKEQAKDKARAAKGRVDRHEEMLKLERRDTDREWKEIQRLEALEAQSAGKSATPPSDEQKPAAPPKDRVFCVLPPKDSAGNRDPCWVRVFMKDVDEVGAHCGLFFTTDRERYERLVVDVAGKVREWVAEAETERVAEVMEEESPD